MYECGYTCVHTCGGQASILGVSLRNVTRLLDMESLSLAWSLWHSWLASPSVYCLRLPGLGLEYHATIPSICTWFLLIKLWSSCLYGMHFAG